MIPQIHSAVGSVGSSSLSLNMFNKGDSRSELFNGVAGRQLPSLAISLDSMKPQVKRAAAGAAPSSGPLKKAPRLDIPEEGLHPGIQVFYLYVRILVCFEMIWPLIFANLTF